MKIFSLKSKNVAGDTIVEVMIALLVLGVSITTVYSIGARSLTSAVEAKKRTEALNLAQSQVDLLIAAKQNGNVANYQINTPYCIPDLTTGPVNASDPSCTGYNGTDYAISVSYANKIFTVTAQWSAANAPGGTATLNLYYKLAG